jgi:hypothetical protein
MPHGEFDYPYPFSEHQEAEAARVAAKLERKRRIAEVKAWAALCVRALGTSDQKPAWGSTVKQAVVQVLRQSLPSATPMDVDRFEDALREISEDSSRAGRAAGALLDSPAHLSALEQAVKVVRAARTR